MKLRILGSLKSFREAALASWSVGFTESHALLLLFLLTNMIVFSSREGFHGIGNINMHSNKSLKQSDNLSWDMMINQ